MTFGRRLQRAGGTSPYDTPTALAIWGSSSAEGYGGGGVSVSSELQTRFGLPFYNGGVGGQWSTHIAARQGGRPGLFTATGNTIPASGSVTMTVSNMTVPGSFNATGTFLGISGTLVLSGGNFVFTRASSGSATAMPADTPFIPTLGTQYRTRGTLIWAGKNDITNNGDMNVCAQTMTAMVNYIPARTRYLVLGHFANSTMPVGSNARTRMDAENSRLAGLYGSLYVDINGYIASSQVWVDSGVTPTSTDLSDQAATILPTSLRYDTGHLNGAGYTAVAKYLGNLLEAKGWFA